MELLSAHDEGSRLKPKIALILAALLTLAASVSPAAAQTAARRSPDLAEVARLVTDRTNEFRRGDGRGPVEPDAKLGGAAQGFANFMARTGRYGHKADGKTPAQRAQEHGYGYCLILENIASLYSSEGFGTQGLAERVMQGWKQSPGHRKNMLDAEVTDIGVAIAQSEKSRTYYAVQLFGRPHSTRIEFRVANASPVTVDYGVNGKAFSLPPRATRTHQECHAVQLTVRLPGERETTTVQPVDGDRYDVERLGSRYRLKKG